MSFHLVSITSNQEVVIFHLTFELYKEQDHTDIAVRVLLSKNTKMLGHTSKAWGCPNENRLVKMQRLEAAKKRNGISKQTI